MTSFFTVGDCCNSWTTTRWGYRVQILGLTRDYRVYHVVTMSVCKKFHALSELFQYEQGNKIHRHYAVSCCLQGKKKCPFVFRLVIFSEDNPSSQGCLPWTPLFSCGTSQIWSDEKIVILTWLTLLLTALPRLLSWSSRRLAFGHCLRRALSPVFRCTFAVFWIRSPSGWATWTQLRKKREKDKRCHYGKSRKMKTAQPAAHFHRKNEDIVNCPSWIKPPNNDRVNGSPESDVVAASLSWNSFCAFPGRSGRQASGKRLSNKSAPSKKGERQTLWVGTQRSPRLLGSRSAWSRTDSPLH